MKRNLIIVTGILLLALSAIGTTVLATQKEVGQHNIKLIYDDKYVLDEDINENANVTIKYNDDILKDLVLTENEVITLDELKLPNNKIISHWAMKQNEDQHIITPKLIEKNEIDISFLTTNGGSIKNETLLPSITKTVEQGTELKKILPDIEAEENYHFAGWFTLGDVEKEIELDEDEQKKLDKELDELNKKLEKKEKELSKEKKEDKEKDLEKEVNELKEQIEEKEKPDVEIINEYQPVEDIENIVLDEDEEYIAVLYPDVNENETDDRKENIKVSIDFGLENEVIEKELHVGQPINLSQPYHQDYIFIDWFTDSNYQEKLGEKKSFNQDTSIYALWKTPKEIVSKSGEELIKEERISDRVEKYLHDKNNKIYEEQKKLSEEKAKKLKAKYEEETAQHTEKKYTLKNFKVKQTFLIKFFDDEEFLFSVALPYGRTLELLNEEGQKIKEYGVRQESSINLSELIKDGESKSFDVKTITRNNAVITQIYQNNNKERD